MDHAAEAGQSWTYWLDGDGQWMNHWQCTGGDIWALLATLVPCSVMFALYVFYALQSHRALSVVRESHFQSHLVALRNVFVLCGSIHLFTHVVGWFVPLYFVSSVMLTANCLLMIALIKSKKAIFAIQQHTQGEVAVEQVEHILEVIHEKRGDSLTRKLQKLEQIIEGTRTRDND